MNPLCSCSLETESTLHFFLRCQNYATLRRALMTDLKNINDAIMSLNESDPLHVILCGNGSFQQRLCTNTKRTHRRTNTQKSNPNKSALQLYLNHTHARMRPREATSHPQNTSPQEITSGRLLLYVKLVLKDLN